MLAKKENNTEMLDGAQAVRLNERFRNAGLAAGAFVRMATKSGSVMNLRLQTPTEAADVLRRIDHDPLFMRGTQYEAPAPVIFAMDRADNGLRGLVCVFRDPARAGSLWLDGNDGLRGPKLHELADALAAAGTDWQKVNFIHKNDRSHLKLVP